ncbi:manganese efflux pump MntP family protein [Bacteroidales bacterium OttesenSCG-928-C19]|nr:manganese efflux pump MntP family protein [Bacteroidales bacterium OttesenSCG-928-C19]
MNISSIIVLALALSIDSMIVSITCGLQSKMKLTKGLYIAFIFAVCQAIFPLLGAMLGGLFQKQIEMMDHWIAFALLSLIGLKMILDIRNINKNNGLGFDISRFIIVLGLGVATSIDAFVVGISIGLEMPAVKDRLIASAIIALVTFLLSMIGIMFGRQNKFFPAKWATAIAGIVLILLGVKILFEHGVLSF